MKNLFISLIYLYAISIISCEQSTNKKSLEELKKENAIDVKNYTGNAYIFNDPEIYGSRCFIIPVNEQDSINFNKLNVEDAIKGRVSIQMFFGHPDFMNLINDKRKRIISYKVCNLPKDSMFFSKVFISYKNCVEIKRNETNVNDVDSCNSKLVERTDSTQFFFRIYQGCIRNAGL